MSKIGVEYFAEALERAVVYSIKEFDMTNSEMVGVLEFCKARIIKQAFHEEDNETDDVSDNDDLDN